MFFFFKQKKAYELRISDWSSDVCSSDLANRDRAMKMLKARMYEAEMQRRNSAKQAVEDSKSDIEWGNQIRSYVLDQSRIKDLRTGVEIADTQKVLDGHLDRSEEHTSELQSLMRISYAVLCLKKKKSKQ